MLPGYTIQIFGPVDCIPAEAENLFASQLANSRQSLRDGPGSWTFALTCAIATDGHVLGGVHIDIGPIGGVGPLKEEKLALLERTLVRPEYQQQGLAKRLLQEAIRFGAEAGCLYIRCSNNWNNPAETALLLRCGFALVDIDGENDPEPCYLAIRPLQNPL